MDTEEQVRYVRRRRASGFRRRSPATSTVHTGVAFLRRCKRLPLPVPAATTAAAAAAAAVATTAAGKCWCLPHPPLYTFLRSLVHQR
jgi:hypothetical protein